MNQRDLDSCVPHRRPHNTLRDGNIFFLISKRPLLKISAAEEILYQSIDGCQTVAQLERAHAGASERLWQWYQAGIVELIAPVTAPSKPHVVVVEPHMDDAALSMGGRLLHLRGQCRITILSVVKHSNFTSYLPLKRDFLDIQRVSELRQEESDLVATLLGADQISLDWTDAPLRFCPANRWSEALLEIYSRMPHSFVNLFPRPSEIAQLAKQLLDRLTALAPDELWIPMGLGDHVDHRLTRSACIAALAHAPGPLSRVPAFMYEDLPYASRVGHAAQVRDALASCGTGLVRVTEDVTDVFDEKVRVVSAYASQFKRSFVEPTLRTAAVRASATQGRLAEASYRMEGEIHLPPESHFCRDRAAVAALHQKIRELLPDRSQCASLTVITIPTGHLGWWTDDREALRAAFPNAQIRVYAPESLAWQAPQGGAAHLELKIVPRGCMGWIRVALREAFRFGASTVVLWQGAYGGKPFGAPKKIANMILRCALPFRRVVFAKTLCDFCGVLNEELNRSARTGHQTSVVNSVCESVS